MTREWPTTETLPRRRAQAPRPRMDRADAGEGWLQSWRRRMAKVKAMPPDEWRGRLASMLQRQRERLAWWAGPAMAADSALHTASADLLPRALDLLPGCRWQEVRRLQLSHPGTYARLSHVAMDRSARLLDGKVRLFEVDAPLELPNQWHRDPRTGYEWARRFYADLRLYELPPGVDVKYVWELNRHQFLVELSRDWLLSSHASAAELARDLILDWIEENPLYEGVNWTSGLEVAVRAISWLWTLAGLAGWPGWRRSDLLLITRSLAEHAFYLERHFSHYSSPYNHLVGEATGLYLLGLWLRTMPEATRWIRLGREVLESAGPRQFHDDGFCVEQATGYHFFTLGFLMFAWHAARSSGDPLTALDAPLRRGLRAAAVLRQPDGRWPAIGDIDSARALPIYPDDPWDYRSLTSLGVVLFGAAELKDEVEGPGGEVFWLQGGEGLDVWRHTPARSLPRRAVWRSAGYVVARGGRAEGDWMLFDAGPIAAGLHTNHMPSVAHGHADTLQVLLIRDVRPVLVDSGMWSYAGDRRWVDAFRQPSAHSTIAVEGAPPAVVAGRLAWSHVHGPVDLDVRLSDDAWVVRGRLRLPDEVVVERYLLGQPGRGYWFADRVASPARRQVQWFWQLPTGSDALLMRDALPAKRIEVDGQPWWTWSTTSDIAMRVDAAENDGPTAWRAPAYGVLQPGRRVTWETTVEGEALLVTYIGNELPAGVVQVGDVRLACGESIDSIATLPIEWPQSEILWHVATEDRWQHIAAGMRSTSSEQEAPWRALDGTGEWDVWYAESPRQRASR